MKIYVAKGKDVIRRLLSSNNAENWKLHCVFDLFLCRLSVRQISFHSSVQDVIIMLLPFRGRLKIVFHLTTVYNVFEIIGPSWQQVHQRNVECWEKYFQVQVWKFVVTGPSFVHPCHFLLPSEIIKRVLKFDIYVFYLFHLKRLRFC